MDTNEVPTLEMRLADIDRALARNEAMLAREPEPRGDGRRTFRRQELEHERRELRTERGQVERRLREATAEVGRRFRLFMPHREVDPATARARRSFDALVAETRDGLEASAEREERAGDHRQARLLRQQATDAAAQIARQYPNIAEAAGYSTLAPR